MPRAFVEPKFIHWFDGVNVHCEGVDPARPVVAEPGRDRPPGPMASLWIRWSPDRESRRDGR